MLATAVLTLSWPVVITLCPSLYHQALNLCQSVFQFPPRLFIPIDLENRTFAIPQNSIRWGTPGVLLDKLEIGEQLHGMREMRVAWNLPGLLFKRYELAIDDNYLVRPASQSCLFILE